MHLDGAIKIQIDEKGKEFRETERLLFLDIETTGLPVSWKVPPTRFELWPHIVEIAYIITDYEGKEIENFRQIAKPEGWTIPAAAVRIHKITNKIAEQDGLNIMFILEALESKISNVDFIIAHNTEFDLQVLEAEFYRYDMNPEIILKTPAFCTMKNFTDYCAIPNRKGYGYKFPKLEELNEIIFGQSIPNAHSALSDAYATMFCFFELKKKGLFSLETPNERKLRIALREKKKEKLELKRKFLKNRNEYKTSEEYKAEYQELYRSLSRKFQSSDDIEILQKRNTMRSNITNRRKTIKKIEEEINQEENLEKLYHLDEKLKEKYTELNKCITEVEVLNNLLDKNQKVQYIKEDYPKLQEKTETQRTQTEETNNENLVGCLRAIIALAVIAFVIYLII